jgi:cytidine deaminase
MTDSASPGTDIEKRQGLNDNAVASFPERSLGSGVLEVLALPTAHIGCNAGDSETPLGPILPPPTYSSTWFPADWFSTCSRVELLKGIDIPPPCTLPIMAQDATPLMFAEIGAITRSFAQRFQTSSFTTLLTPSGKLFFGLPREHSHPARSGTSIECAISVAATSGHHSFPLVATYDLESARPPFSGCTLERLAEHFVDSSSSMKLLHVGDHSVTAYEHRELLPYPAAGVGRPVIAPTLYHAHMKIPEALGIGKVGPSSVEELAPEWLVTLLASKLRELVDNSSADGITRPGRKRHAACVYTAEGDVYFGVNLRSDNPMMDRCAEWNAISAAVVAGDAKKIVGVMVYSPDYKEGSVSCCGGCKDALGDCIDQDVGDMAVVYVGASGTNQLQLFRELPNIPYGDAERRSVRRL